MYIMLTKKRVSQMNRAKLARILSTLCFMGLSAAQAQDSDLFSQSRATSLVMLKELGQKLQSAMADGGAVNAIGVCNLQAPEIAGRVSAQNQVNLSRVGTRARNPVMGVPNDWQAKALAQFDAALARGDKPADMEFSETVVKPDGSKEFHFAKPIVMQPMCVACHGSSDQISPEVKAKLSELYPNDKAVNYQPGQLRGAVVLSRSAP
ncbi:MAG: DUF3365 domain-containing protein [Betaproteobacteria bacterium]|nr:DUF3365 domain-containing protein [Betaproteobacteria bacterium]NBY34560.1 DUF3365 domain-containing protein [Betaproteobacteria bacterium]